MNEYLKLFGAVHVKNALNLPEDIEQKYDECSERLENYSVRKNHNAVLPVMAAFDRDIEFLNTMLNSGLDEIRKIIIGGGYYYGNDLSTFIGGSNWHRDSYNKLPILKIAIYLDGSYEDEQAFAFIPGSHRFGDSFSDNLQTFLKWPNGSGFLPGLDCSVDMLTPKECENIIQPTFIKIKRGDAIVFDIRTIHAVFSQSIKPRRLISNCWIPDVEQAMRENLCGNFSEEGYYEYILKHRCASHICEIAHGRKDYISQKDLPIASSFYSNRLFFDKFSNEELNDLALKYFGSGQVGNKRALDFICSI